MQGASLVPLLKNPEARREKPSISQVARPPLKPKTVGYSLRNERYRYTAWEGAETGEELYDYRNDPHEWTNLADDAGAREVKAELKAQLAEITARRGRAPVAG